MELAEAERAAVGARSGTGAAGLGLADVGQPRDPVEEWEWRCRAQFSSLRQFAFEAGCRLTESDLPLVFPGASPGREVSVYFDPRRARVWKATFPGQSGFGGFGYFTPAGYLRRLRLSNLVFADDVEFEGIWEHREGPRIVTSQQYIQPHPDRFIPTQNEISTFLSELGFRFSEETRFWERKDGVEICDTHNRNFIRSPDGLIFAIDVQTRLKSGYSWEDVIPFRRG